ncbi:unnamed protein product [Linum tenue]|uniref:Dof zinc finger protein n=2 Tax=Linum tenue TaxID=586396 RepID=A0AAV0R9D6_9ROSI|nr:unnamed protein product [Linum tenue]
MGETTATTAKRGMKPFINGVPITATTGGGASAHNHLPPPEQEHLPCPRCDSTNTKFCYYNNYNFSQPRHFCKSCRRYWTQGGTLRDIPVGGGTRKSAKRCRTSFHTTTAASSAATSSAVTSPARSAGVEGIASSQLMQGRNGATALHYGGGDQAGKANFFWAIGGPLGLGLDGKGNGPGSLCGSFTSLLSNPGPGLGSGGFVQGFEDVGFGLGRGIWPLHGMEEGGGAGGGGGGAFGGGNNAGGGSVGMGGITGGNPWQFESGESGFLVAGGGGNDCLSWPDLSISTLGNGLK